MDSNSKFWLRLWGLVFASLVLILLALFVKSGIYNSKRLDALSKAVDPIAFACAEQLDRESVATIGLLCIEKAKK